MRKLIDVPFTDTPTSDYPKGRIRDKNTAVAPPVRGTPINEMLYGDIVQFFHRLVTLGGVTENALPDNITNGYQLVEALLNSVNLQLKASDLETLAGSLATKFVTPANLAAKDAGLITKIIDIGDWDMAFVFGKDIAHGVSGGKDKIKTVSVMIRPDSDSSFQSNTKLDFIAAGDFTAQGTIGGISDTIISLGIKTGGAFNNSDYNSTGGYNRGWVIIQYLP